MDTPSLHQWRGRIANVSFLLLTVAVLLAVVYLLKDFLHAILLGALCAIMLMPLHRWILARLARAARRLGHAWRRAKEPAGEPEPASVSPKVRRLAAFCSVSLVFLLVVVPLGIFGTQVAAQGIRAIPMAQRWIAEDLEVKSREFFARHPRLREGWELLLQGTSVLERGGEGQENAPETVPAPEEEKIQEPRETPAGEKKTELPPLVIRMGTMILQWLKDLLLGLLSRTWNTLFNFFLMLFVMYYVFLDGEKLAAYLKSICPLNQEELEPVAQRIRQVSQAIFYSTLGTAVVQGLLAMLFFRLVGIPALFWGALLGVCSIVPFVGTGLVWVPVAIFLFLTGQHGKALFILVSCGGLVSNVDSLLRPFLMKKGGDTGMSYMVLFFAVLGGLQTFGLAGIIYGPLLMGICGVCLLIFSSRLKKSEISSEKQGDTP
ncbi:MAG: AI-2E family transporter [Oligosphaeraceae bacterium]